jgi:predicted glycosyltransferase involved in capsule biosynthesis
MKLSLIVAYRGRESHLRTQLAWWKKQSVGGLLDTCELVIVEADKERSHWIEKEINSENIQYTYLPNSGTFHKTKALNLGLALSKGQFVAPFDVDLIPIGDTLLQHLKMAELAPHFLVTGYRVMSSSLNVDVNNLAAEIEQTSIAPEDMPTALWKQLIRQERFGVVPLFNQSRLVEIGGWDEAFVGWGGEDQDIIERYLNGGRFLCSSPELVYLHLPHEPNQQWTEAPLVEQNRKHYYEKMQARRKPM